MGFLDYSPKYAATWDRKRPHVEDEAAVQKYPEMLFELGFYYISIPSLPFFGH